MIVNIMSLKDSITKTTRLLFPIWEKATFPIMAPIHVVEHIRKLYAEWQGLKKLIHCMSAKNLLNQQMFWKSLNYLFDVAHQDVMSLMKIEEDHTFLEAQQE